MKKTWYNRLLLSYFPVLLITVSVIIFIFVSMMSEVSIKETEKANRIFSSYVIHSMETSLKGIERMVLDAIVSDEAFYSFFVRNQQSESGLIYYEISKEIRKMMNDNPLIQSIYLYRAEDGLVLTTNMMEKLDNFPDKAFVEQSVRQQQMGWSAIRTYTDFSLQPGEEVISLSKKALLPFGNQGLIVVNVRVGMLLHIVDEMLNRDITFIDIWSGGNRVYPVELINSESGSEEQGKIITRAHSDYIGWDFVSGMKSSSMFGWVSAISHIWILIGAGTILFGIVYMLYVTRRNYRPIEMILQQIQLHQLRGQPGGAGDEFSFIGKVIESLTDQTTLYEKQYKEDLLIRRKQFFQELLEGKTPLSRSDWEASMSRLQLPGGFTSLTVAVIELDRYADFSAAYSSQDQGLFKFALANVVQEFAHMERLSAWAEWIGDARLAVLFTAVDESGTERTEEQQADYILDKLRTWVAVNLRLTVTIGIGREVTELDAIRDSFHEAGRALGYKMSLGNNQVIRVEEIEAEAPGDTHKYFQLMDAMSRQFRIADDTWPLQVDQLAHYLEQDVLSGEDIRQLLEYFQRLFQRSLEGLPPETAESWSREVSPLITRSLQQAETLEELLPTVTDALKQLHQDYTAIRESKNHHQLVHAIRKYIEDHYANPDLSLNLISEQFSVSAKYSSQLFKEEMGMKFVDFLVSLRMDRAKQLLLETEAPIQDISEQVGYTHSISFGRTFKKIVGVTPGDYRKYMRSR
ncbi:helix-turn-helix domain-containing protein [Paenibacillus sp. y28]|uniref:helix-turn-helix domain-containing protein n=1 Tax=Paenibacillus sp. y28 TaxID=3129110 RepID=UPI0030195C86